MESTKQFNQLNGQQVSLLISLLEVELETLLDMFHNGIDENIQSDLTLVVETLNLVDYEYTKHMLERIRLVYDTGNE